MGYQRPDAQNSPRVGLPSPAACTGFPLEGCLEGLLVLLAYQLLLLQIIVYVIFYQRGQLTNTYYDSTNVILFGEAYLNTIFELMGFLSGKFSGPLILPWLPSLIHIYAKSLASHLFDTIKHKIVLITWWHLQISMLRNRPTHIWSLDL